MNNKRTLGAAGALAERLKLEGDRLIERRSGDLARRVMQAVRAEGSSQESEAPSVSRRNRTWGLVGSLAAAVLAILLFTPREDPAHPSFRVASDTPLLQGQAAASGFTDHLRDLVNLGQTLGDNPAIQPEHDLLEREARLFYTDMTTLASGVIAELPLAALPSSWQEKLETL